MGEGHPWSVRRLETVGAVAVFVGGALWHFAYPLSGDSLLVAAVAPANESVWEHLKLVLIPLLVLAALETRWVADRAALWWAKCVEVAAACTFIVAFFYTYTGALGVGSIVLVDVASFLVAVAGGQLLSYRIITSPRRAPVAAEVSIGLLALAVVVLAALTFVPPHVPLFQDGLTGTYGPG